MVCANPDVFVERGDALIYCAGALADAYVGLGGKVLYCGKPHAPIYEAAVDKAAVFRGGEVVARPRARDRQLDQDRPQGCGRLRCGLSLRRLRAPRWTIRFV